MVAHKILETAQSPNSSFSFLFDFGLGLGLGAWTRACQLMNLFVSFILSRMRKKNIFLKRVFLLTFSSFTNFCLP